MSSDLRAGERDSAIGAAESTCPRCGAAREPDQRYCLECGLALPEVSGPVAALRRRWVRRFGWYPGDWVWLALATLLIAVAGAAVAIVVAAGRPSSRHVVIALKGAVPVTAPRKVPERSTKTGEAHGKQGGKLIAWPRNEHGWTIVLVSYPEANGRPSALDAAHAAAASSLRQVGILDSSLYASLQPGYLVVFSGIYASQPDADAGVSTAQQAGFGGAYSREISR